MLSFSNYSPCSVLLPRPEDIDFPSQFQAYAYGPAALQKSSVLFCALKSGSKAHTGQTKVSAEAGGLIVVTN